MANVFPLPSEGASSALTWTDYATRWDTAPTVNSTTGSGTIYDYTLDGTTRFRFVPNTYDPALDAFYEEVDLITLIVART